MLIRLSYHDKKAKGFPGMGNLWFFVSMLLLGALGVVVVLWMRERKQAQPKLTAALEAARTSSDELERLKGQLEAVAGQSYLTSFSVDRVYKLLAKGQVNWLGAVRTHGIVELESGEILPFVVEQPMGSLEEGDVFSPVRGQPVKLDASAFSAAIGTAASAGPEPVMEVDLDVTQPSLAGASLAPSRPTPPPKPSPPPPRPVSVPQEIDSDRTVIFTPGQTLPKVPLDPNAGLAHLEVTRGSDAGTVFYLPFGVAKIGRERANDVPLNDSASSRVHCTISYERHRFLLRDNNSTNGTVCNGEKIREHWLEFGDKVCVADTEMVFSCKGYDLKDEDPKGAIEAFEASLNRQPDFLTALKVQAFLLERNIARKKEAEPLWKRIMELERS